MGKGGANPPKQSACAHAPGRLTATVWSCAVRVVQIDPDDRWRFSTLPEGWVLFDSPIPVLYAEWRMQPQKGCGMVTEVDRRPVGDEGML